MKIFGKLVYLLPFLVLLIAVLAGAYWWKVNLSAVSSEKVSSTFVVQKGWGASQIGNKLKEKGLIRNALVFKIYMQITGKSSKIQAGEYTFSKNLTLPSLVTKLLKGPDLLWVTIPEGLRLEEIALKSASDLQKADKEGFAKEIIALARGKEGYLFPDSYLFAKDATATKVVSMLENTFETKVASLKAGISDGRSWEEVMVMASLIERETKTNEERPVVAGILYKRIDAGWPLQVDAAVQYAVVSLKIKTQGIKLEKYWDTLSKADLEITSPYNTYKYKGLPPAPICSPGLSSIKAALSPTDSEYWFYLHDEKGQIHYAKTIEEHNSNVRKYLGK